jgi:hypothetical protein
MPRRNDFWQDSRGHQIVRDSRGHYYLERRVPLGRHVGESPSPSSNGSYMYVVTVCSSPPPHRRRHRHRHRRRRRRHRYPSCDHSSSPDPIDHYYPHGRPPRGGYRPPGYGHPPGQWGYGAHPGGGLGGPPNPSVDPFGGQFPMPRQPNDEGGEQIPPPPVGMFPGYPGEKNSDSAFGEVALSDSRSPPGS